MKKEISNSLAKSFQEEKKHINIKFDIPKKKTSKVIRDTFTLPEADYNLIMICKNNLLDQKISATKSEIIRMGLKLLNNLTEEEFKSAYALIDKIKVGRTKIN